MNIYMNIYIYVYVYIYIYIHTIKCTLLFNCLLKNSSQFK